MSIYKVSMTVGGSSSSSSDQPSSHISSSYFESTEADRYSSWPNGETSSAKVSDMRYLFDAAPAEEKQTKGPNKDFIDREIDELRQREAEWKELHSFQSFITSSNSMTSEPTITNNSDLLLDLNDNSVFTTPQYVTTLYQQTPDSGYQDGIADVRQKVPKKSVTFEEPDLRPENPKQQIILDEIDEQLKREEELRKHWKDMGLDVKFDAMLHHDDDIDDDDVKLKEKSNGSVFENDDLMTYHVEVETEKKKEKDLEVKKEKEFASHIEPVKPEQKPVVEQKPAVEVKKEVKVAKLEPVVEKEAKLHQSPLASPKSPNRFFSTENVKRMASVQPFSDDEDDDDERDGGKPWLAPQTESVLQRAIRETREREEALRLARGLPALLALDQTDEGLVRIEVSSKSERPVSVSAEPKDRMKKFAASIMEVEMKNEKERELALLKEGTISTLSEQRKGEPMKFVETITPETRKKLEEIALEKKKEKERLEKEKLEKEKLEKEKLEAEKKATLFNSKDIIDGSVEKKKEEAVLKAEVEKPSPYGQYRWIPPRTTPKVFLTYSYDPLSNQPESHELLSKSAAGELLKQEAEEAKRREAELKEMRESLRAEIQNLSFSHSTSTSPKPKVAYPLTPAAVVVHNQTIDAHHDTDNFSTNPVSSFPSQSASSLYQDNTNDVTLFSNHDSKHNDSHLDDLQIERSVKLEEKVKDKAEVKIEVKPEVKSEVKAEVKVEVKAEKVEEKKIQAEEEVKKGPKIVEVELIKDSGVINEQSPHSGDELIAAERKRQKLALIKQWEQMAMGGGASDPLPLQ